MQFYQMLVLVCFLALSTLAMAAGHITVKNVADTAIQVQLIHTGPNTIGTPKFILEKRKVIARYGTQSYYIYNKGTYTVCVRPVNSVYANNYNEVRGYVHCRDGVKITGPGSNETVECDFYKSKNDVCKNLNALEDEPTNKN
jgi:hypothetical protein